MTALFPFQNSFARLPAGFFEPARPFGAPAPALLRLNRTLAVELGLDADALAAPEGVAALAGASVPEGAEPLAAAYAGHQFGNFVPRLGDGRALLLGEVVDRSGRRRDIQLKGAGPTRFSRGGDGFAALGPVLREYLVSEAMHALGIPTTRALAAVLTGAEVYRELPLPGAVLTRVAASHIRVGSFQFFAARGDREGLTELLRFAIRRHDPEAERAGNPALAFLEGVIARQADLVARWMLVGFVHGVMNTDNMTVSGETIDYGPCAFLDRADPEAVFSSIDRMGRYAFRNQPGIALWNLTRLAEALLPLLADEEAKAIALAEEALDGFAARFLDAHLAGMRRKLGLLTEEEGDRALADDLLKAMAENGADHTLLFRRLADAVTGEAEPARSLFIDPTRFDAFAERWHQRLAREPQVDPAERRALMRRASPAVIPRNHRVEEALAAAHRGDMAPFSALERALARPFDDPPADLAHLADEPPADWRDYRTFCGT
ncbi:YdiU family protein [Aureimonas sp. AU4]|uniref:protein adenylyltransferase SelO n=1 Tax=Aureimonas sp. AU4 TaxID=1638163 RepID=UPI0007820E15|nr:YdiU family protein [Aureimonas sp. AU4]